MPSVLQNASPQVKHHRDLDDRRGRIDKRQSPQTARLTASGRRALAQGSKGPIIGKLCSPYLAPEPRTRHAHRALADGAPHHVRALEAWVHLFPFREAHTHTCIAPHGTYRSGEYDDEASELRHRRERLLALRRARATAAADGE